jgi:hypothetical protein
MKPTGLTEKAKLALSLIAIVAAGAVWGALSLVGVEMSFLMFAVLTLLFYFVILAVWRRND